MICSEKFREGYVITFSDAGYRIKQIETGRVFSSAVDIEPCRYTYEETEELRTDVDKVRIKTLENIIDIIEGSEGG